MLEVGPGRPPRRHEHRAVRRGRDHEHRVRSPAVPRRHARGHRGREGRHHQAGHDARLRRAPARAVRRSSPARAAIGARRWCPRGMVPRARAASSRGAVTLDLATPVRRYAPVTLALRGSHQVSNALVAVRLLEALDAAGIRVPAAAVEAGLRDARWPGRLEIIELEDGRTRAAGRRAQSRRSGDARRAPARDVSRRRAAGVRRRARQGPRRDAARAAALREPPRAHRARRRRAPRRPRICRPSPPRSARGCRSPAWPTRWRRVRRAWSRGPGIVVAGSIFLLGAVRPALVASRLG